MPTVNRMKHPMQTRIFIQVSFSRRSLTIEVLTIKINRFNAMTRINFLISSLYFRNIITTYKRRNENTENRINA